MRSAFANIFNKSWKMDLALLVSSFGIYFFHFPSIFLNLNKLLSSITLDSIKNYYTFVYHIKNDAGLIHFEGMNYPVGEHLIYTDCQPLITFILRYLPFTHEYLIGILHILLFASFIVTPLILYRILKQFISGKLVCFLLSLAIALLSPQFLKINAGHLALAYGCMIPLSILFLLNALNKNSRKAHLIIFVYNTAVFFIHPYMGFCLSIFSFFALLFSAVTDISKLKKFRFYLMTALAGLFPIVFFKVFMLLTDHHNNRTSEPYGNEVMVENLDSLLAPVFGPFQSFLELFFNNRPQHFEGHTYLGFFSILLTLGLILAFPFLLKKIKIDKKMLAVFLSSIVILLISFGLHHQVLNLLNLKISAVSQFRAVCRFAWVFYFTLPLFTLSILLPTIKSMAQTLVAKRIAVFISTAYLLFNLFESAAMFHYQEEAYWKFRNFFTTSELNKEEQEVLKRMNEKNVQAILPLPTFHGGSEMYERNGSSNSMIPSMIYSYHAGKPIFSVMMSRTSITETEDFIQTFNSYKKERNFASLFSNKDFLVIKTNEALLPDEERLEQELHYFQSNDSLSFAFLSKENFLKRKLNNKQAAYYSNINDEVKSDSIIFIPAASRKPFVTTNMRNDEKIIVLDSNSMKEGEYLLSFNYHFSERIFQSLGLGLITTESTPEKYEWADITGLRKLSGFYDGYAVFEKNINIRKGVKYEFILSGLEDRSYHISNFLIRPRFVDTFFITAKGDTVINNFYP